MLKNQISVGGFLSIKKYSHNTMEIKQRVPKKRQYRTPIYQTKVNGFPVESPQLLDRIKDSPLFPKKPWHMQLPSCEEDRSIKARTSKPPVDFNEEVLEKRHFKSTWKNSIIKVESAKLKCFFIE